MEQKKITQTGIIYYSEMIVGKSWSKTVHLNRGKYSACSFTYTNWPDQLYQGWTYNILLSTLRIHFETQASKIVRVVFDGTNLSSFLFNSPRCKLYITMTQPSKVFKQQANWQFFLTFVFSRSQNGPTWNLNFILPKFDFQFTSWGLL